MTIAATIAARTAETGKLAMSAEEEAAVSYTVGMAFGGMRYAFTDGSAGFRPWATTKFEDLGCPSEAAIAFWADKAPCY
jgi:hypothetical protein